MCTRNLHAFFVIPLTVDRDLERAETAGKFRNGSA